ncbi:MAG: peroxidase family protein [Pirellulaceae bacterium]
MPSRKSASNRNRSQRRTRSNKRFIERLEKRELLAADMMAFHHNLAEPTDVNNDSVVSAIDVLMVMNELNARGTNRGGGETTRFLDVNNDEQLTPIDALSVVNEVNRRGRGGRDGGDRRDDPRDDRPDDNLSEPQEFASIDGTGNNIENPEQGSTGEEFSRWVSAEYEDGLGAPAHPDWASAREVSNILNSVPTDENGEALDIDNSEGLSDLTWIFGQFIDHDITLSGEGHDESFAIEVPEGDAFFDPFGTGEATIGLTRSAYETDSDALRQQFNEISAFIDGSVIYGSDQARSDALRTFERGKLATSEGDLLPFNELGLLNAGGDSVDLFIAGDIRANENSALAAMHTVWVREHNNVAERIAEENPELSDEEIFQQARQYVTAELQSITYNEFLPALLGRGAINDYEGYDSSVDPSISNVFATAAYRFGHTMLSSELLRLNEDGSVAEEGNLALQDAFFNVDALTENGIDSILRGAATQTAQEVDPFIVDDVRNFLFGPPGAGGFDLASLNIQRGRDHGLADYNQIRSEMGLDPITSFAEISSDPSIQARLEEAYGDVDSIDAWVGMLAEDHTRGSTLGETATLIIAEQFQALRDGDRFYYENVFSGSELNEIQNASLADVIERNSGVDFARGANAFQSLESQTETPADGDGRRDGDRNNGIPNIENDRRERRRVDEALRQMFEENQGRLA